MVIFEFRHKFPSHCAVLLEFTNEGPASRKVAARA